MRELLDQVRRRNSRAVARTISQVENSRETARDVIQALHAETGKAHIIGVTGPPGCGKSTLVNELAKTMSSRDQTVGIIAVDPTSPFTGGALLGDRVRMVDVAAQENVFIRSMASRGSLGGLAMATSAAIKILDAAGYEVILVETVGAGQVEVDIAKVAHTVLVVEAPGSGDEVQSLKAGILEIADILIVNKADRPSANHTVRTLEMMLNSSQVNFGHHAGQLSGQDRNARVRDTSFDEWQIPVLQTIAVEGMGIIDLLDRIDSHYAYLNSSGEWQNRERRHSWLEVERLLQSIVLTRLDRALSKEKREQLITAVAQREMDPYFAALQLFENVYRDDG